MQIKKLTIQSNRFLRSPHSSKHHKHTARNHTHKNSFQGFTFMKNNLNDASRYTQYEFIRNTFICMKHRFKFQEGKKR